MKLKAALVCIGLLFSSILWADNCQGEKDGLIASYEVDTFHRSVLNDQAPFNGVASKTMAFNFIRKNNNLITYQYPEIGISKSWYRSKNNRINAVHYFYEFQRAIEYDNGDLPKGMNKNWAGMYPMMSQAFLNSMDSKKRTDDCEMTFNHKQGGQSWNIVWSESLNIPLEMTHIAGNRKTVLKLNAFKNDMKAVQSALAKLNAYQSTDYADIGDNESDPFLRKMIRLGFVKHGASGFYDAQGNALEASGHSSHSH